VGAIEEFLTGKMGSAPLIEHTLIPDRVLATILFTDIVNSTIRASEMGDQKWNRLLYIHDKVSKEQIKYHRGRFIKSTGDGLLATFDGPGRAIMCAKRIKEKLRDIGVEIRSGIHTGEIENRGQDIGGISVHIASRIESKANPGEILVSRTVKDLVAGSGSEFKEKGIFDLKGIPDSWELFSVV
jgi:class 3 adenylate cyclase